MNNPSESGGQYVVVARRYRPQGFDELIGQGMVSQALSNAIESERVGHAYLFTGARGVGKTSTARIFAKALNCETGPSPTPCHKCDICETIATGDDVDVLEIDGASNRGIDEIRQLRSNVNVRPSRSRYKIYIIDEVHMLTKEAFNALLKTLEEPPRHVKFIFCTTDPEKIPITVLSRCQRFDFSPVSSDEIVDRLKFIVESEGASADEEALRVLARKASGSVRDSQSLLEQLMSFTSERITLDAVNSMLGTAGTARLHGVLRALSEQNACQALTELDQAIGEGVDAGQLTEQLLGCVRDLLALSVGGGKELLLYSSEAEAAQLAEIATGWGTASLLAAAQIIDQALARMRMVTYSRVLLETALIRIAKLEDLQALSEVISQMQSGQPITAAAPKKKTASASDLAPAVSPAAPAPTATAPVSSAENVRVDPPQASEPVGLPRSVPVVEATKPVVAGVSRAAAAAISSPEVEVTARNEAEKSVPIASQASSGDPDSQAIWKQTISQLEGLAADCASQFEHAANSAPNRLVITFPAGYTSSKAFCERPEKHSEMERIASSIAGRKLKLEFHVRAGEKQESAASPRRAVSARQRQREALQHPFVKRALEVFEGEVTGVSAPKQNRS